MFIFKSPQQIKELVCAAIFRYTLLQIEAIFPRL
jgi:hypothetical protein